MTPRRLFVYGTLKRGGKNHARLAGQVFVGAARSVPGFRLYSFGEYPGLVADPTDDRGVTGEIWAVDARTLAALDEFEGVDEGLYARVPIRLQPPFDDAEAETYLYLRSTAGRPLLGDEWQV